VQDAHIGDAQCAEVWKCLVVLIRIFGNILSSILNLPMVDHRSRHPKFVITGLPFFFFDKQSIVIKKHKGVQS
jgi:hypothetical protein